ncbi:Unknown protein sequence [Pseudomonas syringae pv. cilantro]|uniref:Uncharacterized protein n=1 Tax=Pseudomonas syringae pv. cilantro TaxID=81035 RepID=A0A0N0XDT1_PSESX|nr:Unknown protein sequence [Pseudomonas syringae pv. cilantro]
MRDATDIERTRLPVDARSGLTGKAYDPHSHDDAEKSK